MKPLKVWTPVLLTVVFFIVGCSQGASPVDTNVSESIEPVAADAYNAHSLLGLYTFICDPENATVDITPQREVELHLNALKFLEPPPFLYLTLEGPPQFNGNILDVDIGLTHPFLALPQFTGFDVCGIVFTHGSVTGLNDPDIVMAGEGDTRLLNADGYTRWWNPAEFPHGDTIYNYIDGLLGTPADQADFNCTVNGYKYFADGLDNNDPLTALDLTKRGMFSAGKKNIRHYTIDMSGGLIFNYAVDACWAIPLGSPPYNVPDDFPQMANRPEAYNITVTELENTLFYEESTGSAGGDLSLLLDVWDHFDSSLNHVSAESLAGLPFVTATTPIDSGDGYSTYELSFAGDDLMKNGEAELLITAQSEDSGYGGILPGKPVCAYFTHTFTIDHNPPPYPPGWARTWGGAKGDLTWRGDIEVDSEGSIYVTGGFRDTVDFDPGPGVEEHTAPGNWNKPNAFLCKFDSDGEFQWAGTWGDHHLARGQGVAIDGLGYVFVTGYFAGTVDFDPGPGIDEHHSPDFAAFLSKFDSNGSYQWVRIWPGVEGTGSVQSFNLALDDLGNIYVTGDFVYMVDFDPGPDEEIRQAVQSDDVFLSKFNANGDFQWVRTWGGNNHDHGLGLVVDSFGMVYTCGSFNNTVDFDPGPEVVEYTAYGDYCFISKFDPAGDFQWARVWGEISDDSQQGMAIDEFDNLFVTCGFVETVDFDPGPGVVEYTAVERDAYLSKFDSDGNFIWVRVWGGEQRAYGKGVAVDGVGNVYVTGWFSGKVDFDPGPGVNEYISNGLFDIYLSKLDSEGDFHWARIWGSEERDDGKSVTTDMGGNIYTIGNFRLTVDFCPGPAVDWHASNGEEDIYLMKINPYGYW